MYKVTEARKHLELVKSSQHDVSIRFGMEQPQLADVETNVSRHHGGTTEETPRTSHRYCVEGFKEVFKWSLIMPRDGSLISLFGFVFAVR